MTREFLTDADLALLLKVTEKRVAAMRREHNWRVTKIGRTIRYSPEQVEQIVASHEFGGDTGDTPAPLIEGQSKLSAARSA